MKVLHLNAGNETGGGMHHILGLMKELNRDQFILGVLERGELLERAEKEGINTVYFTCNTRLSLPLIRKIRAYIIEQEITFIHTHGPRANVYANMLKRLVPFQWITTIHSHPLHDFMGRGMYGRLLSRVHINAVRRADKLIAISDNFKKSLSEIGITPGKIVTTLNGIDFSECDRNTYSKKEFGIPENAFLLLMVARLEPVKGHELALKAFAKLLLNNNDCHLMLAGDGGLRAKLEKQAIDLGIASHIHFVGHRDDIDCFYEMADVTMLTSFSESFPLVLLESAKARTPVIATDVGAIGELIMDKSYGWRIKPNNVRELHAAMLDALFMFRKGMLPLIGSKLQSHAAQKFTLEKLAENIYNVYLSMKKID